MNRHLANQSWDRTAVAVCSVIMVMAVVVLVGWHAHISAAVQIFHGLVPMQYNSALCFFVLGIAGLGLIRKRSWVLLIGGSLVAMMGAVVILEYATGTSFGIDTLFFYPWEQSKSADPGRMALTTAVSFFLTGLALVIQAGRTNAYGAFGIVNLLPLSLALTSLIGYAFQIDYVLPFNLGSQMALHTSSAFLAYGIAMLGYAWKRAARGADGLPKWAGGIGVALLPVLLVAASAVFPQQSWRVVPFEAIFAFLIVALITLAVRGLTRARVAYKGLLMISIPLSLLLIFVGLVVHVKHESENTQVLALHSSDVLAASQAMVGRLNEAESAVRGYLITDDKNFVSSFQSLLDSITQSTIQLRDLVSDNPIQEARAVKIAQLTAERIAYLRQVRELLDLGQKESAAGIIRGGEGTELMLQVRAEMAGFTQEEERLGAARRQVMDQSWQKLSWLLVAGTAAAIILASMLILLFSGGISRRLQQLRDNALRLATGGELAPRLAGHDEIADLDQVFHELAGSLDEATRREKAVIEGTTDAIYIKDLNYRYLMINPAGADMVNKTVDEIIGLTNDDLLMPESAHRIRQQDDEILASGQTITYELAATNKAGEERTYLSTRGPYRNRIGAIVGILGISRDISEQKRASVALASSEKTYRALVDDGQGLICTHDLEGKLLTINPAAAESLGYTPAEMVGRNLIELIPVAARHAFPGYLKQICREKTVSGLLHLLSKQGGERIWRFHNTHIDEPGAPTFVLGYAQDVTDSQRAEEKLRAATQRLSLAIQVGNFGVWDWEVKTDSLYWDPRMFDIYGIAPGTVMDFARWTAAVDPEDRPAVDAALQLTIAQKRQQVTEFRIHHADGSLRYVQAAEGVILDHDGQVERVIGLNLDITERKRAEEALRASEIRFQNAFDHAPTGIALVSPAGQFLQVNEYFCRMVGYAEKELLALDFRSITQPDDLAASQETMQQLLAGEFSIFQIEKRYVHKLGHDVFAQTHLSLVRDAQARPLYFIAQMQDITERRRAEAERQVIAEVVQGVMSTGSLDELFGLVQVSLGKILSAENCFVALYDRSTDLLHMSFYKDKLDSIAAPQKLGRGLSAYVLRTGRPLFLTPELNRELLANGDIELVGTVPAAWLGVPLRASHEIIGVLVVQSYEDQDAYSRQDLELLTAVGNQLGLAIEHKQVEIELKTNERRLIEAQHIANLGSWEWNVVTDHVRWSDELYRMFGLKPEEHSATFGRFMNHIHPDDRERLQSDIAQTLHDRVFKSSEYRIIRVDGTVRAVHCKGEVTVDETGQVISMWGTLQDITERMLTEEALVQSEQRFRDLFENASDVIYTADFAGNFTSINRSGEKMTGYTRDEAVQLNFSQVVSPETFKLIQEMTRRKLESSDETVYEIEIFKKNGDPLLVEVSSRAIYENGKPVGIQGIGRDITQRKQVEAELKHARDAALESVRTKSEFLANMSHEIRTPMNGVIGMTGLLLDTELSSDQREYTETIQFSADALLTIINDILDFSKIEAGLLRFEKIDFKLHAAVEAPVELLAERAAAKGLELASLVYRDVPAALRGDPGRLRQVLTNLIGNAVKFTAGGEVVVSVTKDSETATHATLRFEIQDTGIGISPEAQHRLFRAFAQADGSTTRKYGGTGLGLAISKQLVEIMGGEIGVKSVPGQGSTFWFTGRFEKQLNPAVVAQDAAHSLTGLRVLIVDDNDTNRKILHHQTSSWGMIAVEANGAAQALERLRAAAADGTPFDVALLDLMMPGLDGFQLTAAIKSEPAIAAVKVVLLPSYGKLGHGAKARQLGIAAYLQKPVRQAQLYDCLTTVMAPSLRAPEVAPRLVSQHSLRESVAQEQEKTLSPVRILIAEDNAVNRKVALGQLYSLGYRAEAVSNGRELLEKLDLGPADIILMDCQMPELDGFAATAEIRRREGSSRHTIIIALTANALDGESEKCLAAGMDDYLSKPVKPDLLRMKLDQWVKPAE